MQIDYRWAGGDPGRAKSSAMELIGLSPAVIIGSGTVAMVALHGATATVPFVFLNVTDPSRGICGQSRATGGQHYWVHAVRI
jgi:putative ABC transport system substrate-binding protein